MSKLAQTLLENELPENDWHKSLGSLFKAAFDRQDFGQLSQALGHDPDDDDALSPEDLQADEGWTWDCVREVFRNPYDETTVRDVSKWLGIDLDDTPSGDLDETVRLAQSKMVEHGRL